ncbi:MAG TPA: PEP-CTERM sorting domain-containing protein [Vicinamibacterales bacterium]|nr:PEP-CTERM sorting domain-containing protein [Vicinamibacterales bacterium]
MSRPILVACGILAIAAAAAAMRGTSWSPVDAFLDYGSVPVSQQQAALTNDVEPTGLRGTGRTPFGPYQPAATPPGAVVSGSSVPHDGAKGASTYGFGLDHVHGAFSSGGSGPSASAGNLWRLMGLGHGRSTQTPTAAATHASTPARPPKAPAQTHTPAAHSGSGGSHGSSGPSTTTITAPAILIGNNAAPVGSLIGDTPTTPGGGTFAPGAPGGLHTPNGGPGFSATPEPASILLLGTGLIALAAMLRRVRA